MSKAPDNASDRIAELVDSFGAACHNAGQHAGTDYMTLAPRRELQAALAEKDAELQRMREALQIIHDGFARGAFKSKLLLLNVDDEATDTMPTTAAEIVRAALNP
jgi:hypothetical protein